MSESAHIESEDVDLVSDFKTGESTRTIRMTTRTDRTVFHLSVLIFGEFLVNILVPLFDVGIRRSNPNSRLHHIVLFLFYLAVCVATNNLFGPGLVLVWLMTMAGIALMLPAYFLWVQQYKNELQGPWDPAKPIIRRQDS